MASPIPPDPYSALGVAKDAEISTIRTAYRKLVLIHHPDRIKDESLREKGKDNFQKIQQAWELVSDPVKRQRYDDRMRLAELRKDRMTRESPPGPTSTSAYTTRPSTAPSAQPPPTPSAREYREDGNYFEEVRQPRNMPSYDDQYVYDEPSRNNSRKHAEYEKRAPPNKTTEKRSKAASAFTTAGLAAQFTSKLRTQAAEKAKTSRAEEKRSDREKRRERTEKVQTRRSARVDDYSSDSDYTEVRPSPRPSSQSKTTSEYPRTSSRNEKTRDADAGSFDGKWERHHDDVKAYISKASNRPSLDRSGSDAYQYWASSEPKGRKSGSDSEKRPNSSKGRHSLDDYFMPSFNKSSSSPSNLRAHVQERAPPRSTVGVSRDHRERDRDRERERDRDRGRDKDREHDRERDHRKGPPPLPRSHTTPLPGSSSKKGSNLKHGEAQLHDSGYGSSSSPHTPETREQSPPRSSKGRFPSTTSTKYQIVDPEVEDDEGTRTPRITKIHTDDDRYAARYHSPEAVSRDAFATDRRSRDKPERPRVDTGSRGKSSRGASMMQEMTSGGSPTIRRGDSGRYEERHSPRSPHDVPPLSRHDSGREKLFMEVSPDDRYNRPYPMEKINVTPRRDATSAKYANYPRDGPEFREADYRSRFPETFRTARRPSVY